MPLRCVIQDGRRHALMRSSLRSSSQRISSPRHRPVRFSILWTSAFLPAQHQGVYINHSNLDLRQMIPWLHNERLRPVDQRRQPDLMKELNQAHLSAHAV